MVFNLFLFRHLLKHPVITSFLWFKWERIRPYFNRNLRLYLLFVFLLTWFIFATFGGHSQRETIEATFAHLYIGVALLMVVSIGRDWWKDIKVNLSFNLLTSMNKSTYSVSGVGEVRQFVLQDNQGKTGHIFTKADSPAGKLERIKYILYFPKKGGIKLA